jgi:hypothetical protein
LPKRQLTLSRRFDGILAWDSFFHLDHDDQRRMFAIFADHACVGAVLMFNTGPQHGEGVGEYRGDPLYHASLSPAEYEVLTARFGFQVLQHVANDAEAGGRTVWLCRKQRVGVMSPVGPERTLPCTPGNVCLWRQERTSVRRPRRVRF